jgi:hypothetical protein
MTNSRNSIKPIRPEPAPERPRGRPDGSLYKMVTYPRAGYWVAYSRTTGDSPMVMIAMQKTP